MKYNPGEDQRGFTLPEVMITIAILGILVGIAVPTWQSVVEGRRVDSATNQFASDLRLAHSRATNQLKDWKVVYSLGSSSYRLVPEGGTVIIRSLPEGTKVLDTEVVDLSGNRNIIFKPDGSAVPEGGFADSIVSNGEIDVVVSAEDGAPKHGIRINPTTSRVQVG